MLQVEPGRDLAVCDDEDVANPRSVLLNRAEGVAKLLWCREGGRGGREGGRGEGETLILELLDTTAKGMLEPQDPNVLMYNHYIPHCLGTCLPI